MIDFTLLRLLHMRANRPLWILSDVPDVVFNKKFTPLEYNLFQFLSPISADILALSAIFTQLNWQLFSLIGVSKQGS